MANADRVHDSKWSRPDPKIRDAANAEILINAIRREA
jgi:hypothetical protein